VFGYLITAPTGGQFMQIESSGHLDFATAQEGNASTLFTADLSGAAQVTTPISCGYDGFVRQLETGDKDNVGVGGTGGAVISFKLITRPFLFQQALRDKRARAIRLSSQQRSTSSVSVRVSADGADQTVHTLSYPISAKPTVKKARVGGKGIALPVEITSNDDIKVGSVELAAAVQRQSI